MFVPGFAWFCLVLAIICQPDPPQHAHCYYGNCELVISCVYVQGAPQQNIILGAKYMHMVAILEE